MPGSLAARDISKSYAAVQVLDRVSLVVSPGDRVGIVGPNGIGKSTLLRVLAGLEQPDRGQIVRGGAVGLLPQEPEAARGRDGARLPRSAHRRRRRGARDGRAGGPARRRARARRRLRRRPRPLPRARRRGLRGARPCRPERRRARPAHRAPDDEPLRRRGGPRRPGGGPARPLRRLPARRADEQPRLRGPRAARAVPRRPRGRCRPRLARPRLPRPVRDPRGRDRGRDAEGARVHRHLDAVRGGARAGAGPARARLRRLPRRAEPLLRAPAGAARGGAPAGRRAQARAPDGRLRPPRRRTPSAAR